MHRAVEREISELPLGPQLPWKLPCSGTLLFLLCGRTIIQYALSTLKGYIKAHGRRVTWEGKVWEKQLSTAKDRSLPSSTTTPLLHPAPSPHLEAVTCRVQGLMGPRLTLHIHTDGLDGRHAHAVLGLAVVAAALRAGDALDPQRLVEHRCLLELVRCAAGSLGPPHLGGQSPH